MVWVQLLRLSSETWMLSPLLLCHLMVQELSLLLWSFFLYLLPLDNKMAACVPGSVFILTEERRSAANLSSFTRKAKIYRIPQGNVYLCLTVSSCILGAPLNAREARDQGAVIVSPGTRHMAELHSYLLARAKQGLGVGVELEVGNHKRWQNNCVTHL